MSNGLETTKGLSKPTYLEEFFQRHEALLAKPVKARTFESKVRRMKLNITPKTAKYRRLVRVIQARLIVWINEHSRFTDS